MNNDEVQKLFAQIRAFEWNEKKRETNRLKHQIDFQDAKRVIDGPAVIRQSNRGGETRYVIYGFVGDDEVAVICTLRGNKCRIISARRARSNERRKYHRRL